MAVAPESPGSGSQRSFDSADVITLTSGKSADAAVPTQIKAPCKPNALFRSFVARDRPVQQ